MPHSKTIPLGGVGNSGSGTWQGKYRFEALTHNCPGVSVPGSFGTAVKASGIRPRI